MQQATLDGSAPPGSAALRMLPSRLARQSTLLGPHAVLREFDDPTSADFVLPPSDALAIIVVTAGSYLLETGPARSGRRALMSVGSSAATAPGREVRARWSVDPRARLRSRQLHVDGVWLAELAAELGVSTVAPDHLHRDDGFIAAALRALAESERVDAPRLHTDAIVLAIVGHLLLHGSSAPVQRRAGLDDRTLMAVTDHMRAHLHEPISLHELAAIAHLSRHHFLRRFAEATQTTPIRYLTTLRMEHARSLLRTDLPIGVVAQRCGYRDASSFSAAFRRCTGATPTAYRATL